MKYLAAWINGKLRWEDHIAEKRTSIVKAFNSLKKVGITDAYKNEVRT